MASNLILVREHTRVATALGEAIATAQKMQQGERKVQTVGVIAETLAQAGQLQLLLALV